MYEQNRFCVSKCRVRWREVTQKEPQTARPERNQKMLLANSVALKVLCRCMKRANRCDFDGDHATLRGTCNRHDRED